MEDQTIVVNCEECEPEVLAALVNEDLDHSEDLFLFVDHNAMRSDAGGNGFLIGFVRGLGSGSVSLLVSIYKKVSNLLSKPVSMEISDSDGNKIVISAPNAVIKELVEEALKTLKEIKSITVKSNLQE